MTEAENRTWLSTMSTPKLDAFRKQLRSFSTSELVLYLIGPRTLNALFSGDPNVIKAAMLALCDEIDRRVPVPE